MMRDRMDTLAGIKAHFEKKLEWLPGAAGRHLFNANGGS